MGTLFEEETQSRHLQDQDHTPSQSTSANNSGHIQIVPSSKNMDGNQFEHMQDRDHVPNQSASIDNSIHTKVLPSSGDMEESQEQGGQISSTRRSHAPETWVERSPESETQSGYC